MDSSEMQSTTNLRHNLKLQVSELDMLESMFSKPGEFKIDDAVALENIKNYINGITSVVPPYLDITLNVTIDNSKFEVCVTFPHEYPNSEPDIFIRNQKLTKTQHIKLKKDLTEYIMDFKGEPCIFTAVMWLQDNMKSYVDAISEISIMKLEKSEKLVRYWIYSHHIYSKSKRREILNLANTLKLSGFCMPGKPGIICIEGHIDYCLEWWQDIKSMNWKKIFCKVTEEAINPESFLKFKTFEEIVFQNNSVKCNHMDMGELYKFLENHECSYIFKDLFGVDTKSYC